MKIMYLKFYYVFLEGSLALVQVMDLFDPMLIYYAKWYH